MNIRFYAAICSQLIWCDLVVFRQVVIEKIIDLAIWAGISICVAAYVMPYFGVSQTYGLFQLGGVIAATGIFQVYEAAMSLVLDFDGDRTIDYRLTLPIPSWSILLSKCMYFSITYFILSLSMVPVGKICLWHEFDVTRIHYAKFLIALIAQNLFYGCFSLFVASLTANVNKLGMVWSRFIFPMWFLGGYCFSWTALHTVMPTFSWIALINPMIYITEATRASIMGQDAYLNYWLCIATIICFSVLCFLLGLYKTKKRLDYV